MSSEVSALSPDFLNGQLVVLAAEKERLNWNEFFDFSSFFAGPWFQLLIVLAIGYFVIWFGGWANRKMRGSFRSSKWAAGLTALISISLSVILLVLTLIALKVALFGSMEALQSAITTFDAIHTVEDIAEKPVASEGKTGRPAGGRELIEPAGVMVGSLLLIGTIVFQVFQTRAERMRLREIHCREHLNTLLPKGYRSGWRNPDTYGKIFYNAWDVNLVDEDVYEEAKHYIKELERVIERRN